MKISDIHPGMTFGRLTAVEPRIIITKTGRRKAWLCLFVNVEIAKLYLKVPYTRGILNHVAVCIEII